MINKLPLYFHPTEILLVDDDINYSRNVETIMWNKEIPIQVFNDPKKALEFIKKKSIVPHLDQSVHIEEEYLEKTIFNIDLSALHKKAYKKNRFNEISVVIVDYAMPGLNGKEFFEKIQHIPLKKILLTGEEGYETAVKMFNVGLIDRFYRKNDEDLFERLFKEIAELKTQFFQDMSHAVLSALEKKSSAMAFTHQNFIKFFIETLKDNQIVEYYALDQDGSYLLINGAGLLYLLAVKSAHDMQVLYEIAEGEKDVQKNILADLKNKKKLPYFLTEKDHLEPANDWSLYDAYSLPGDSSFYYALVKNAPGLKSKSEIGSYQQFLERHS